MSLKRLLKCSGLVYIGKKKLNTVFTSWPYLIDFYLTNHMFFTA